MSLLEDLLRRSLSTRREDVVLYNLRVWDAKYRPISAAPLRLYERQRSAFVLTLPPALVAETKRLFPAVGAQLKDWS